MTLKELRKIYFQDEFVSEIKNSKQARSLFKSRTSCCWGNTIIEDTGWALLARPSARHLGDKRTVFVCKAELLKQPA